MNDNSLPLAERMRPQTLEDYVGQAHLIAKGAPLRNMIEQGYIPSLILWGPPGVGKTTLAEIISRSIGASFYTLSAVSSGVKEVREVLENVRKNNKQNIFNTSNHRPILFIDEIHRFNKSQQDSLLSAIERGEITLIGATTENPSFEIIRPLLSRCEIYVLQSLSKEDLLLLAQRAITTDARLHEKQIQLKETAALLRFSGGDARKLLNLIELAAESRKSCGEIIKITDDVITKLVQYAPAAFDKGGELHYDMASAFIKSIRGSDPQAAVYWLARLLDAGEEPRFVARRIIISAAEDIGLANPNALLLANAAAQAVEYLGMPEARIPLSEAVIYLANSPKSNSAYKAINSAMQVCKQTGNLPVPLHLRNAPTELMNQLGYGAEYKYPHDYPRHWVEQQYLPDAIKQRVFYSPDDTERKH